MIPLLHWVAVATALFAEPVKLAGVPTALPQAVREPLIARRESIRDVIRKFNAAVEALEARCNGVPPNDSRYQACARDDNELSSGLQQIERLKQSFNADVHAALLKAGLVSSVRLGNVTISGDVQVQGPDGKPIDAGRLASLDLPLGTKIITGPTGSFKADAPGLHTFNLGAGGELTLDSVFVNPSSIQQLHLNLQRGYFRWLHQEPEAPADPEPRDRRRDGGRFRVRTPTCVLAIRGTDVQVDLKADGSGTIRLYSGDVAVMSPDSTRRVELRPGQMTTITTDGRVTEPVAIPSGTRPPSIRESTYIPRREP